MKHRTEQVYDDEMSPLVAQLIAIAKRENIPLLVSAGMLVTEDDHGNVHDNLTKCTCDTIICTEGADARLRGVKNRYNLAYGVIRSHDGMDTAAGLTITRFHPPDPDAPRAGAVDVLEEG